MTNLAIKGHKTRSGEVIKTLEMLGGVNRFNLEGNTNAWYVLEEGRTIRWCEWIFEEKGFTLEEFLEKFPYKTGDRVRVPEYESEVCISKMYWDGNEVQYEVVTDEVEWYSAKELNEFNEPNKPNKEKKINQMSLTNCDLDEVEIVLGDKFELKIEDGKYYAVKKKSQYPKTYEECCKILDWNHRDYDRVGYNSEILCKFQVLLLCRDAYWKIAGEQMGLGKPWKPDWSTEYEKKYVIEVYRNKVRTNSQGYSNTILAFPTAEMRDAFQENFWVLIEFCKELL